MSPLIRAGLAAAALLLTFVPSVAAAPARQADRALERALDKVVEAPGGPPGVFSI